MKRYILKQIVSYLQKFKKIYAIERVEDSVIKIVFDKNEVIFFDMKKGSSSIYKKDDYNRSSKKFAKTGVVDMLALSKCTKIYGSLSSSFDTVASYIGNKELIMPDEGEGEK